MQLVGYVAQMIYETGHRPEASQHAPWLERVEQQLAGAISLMEGWSRARHEAGSPWMFGNDISQADISIAVAWRFIQHIDRARRDADAFPSLAAFSAQAEALPEFLACPLSG